MAAFGLLVYTLLAFVNKWKPFEPKDDDACLPKSDEKVDKGVTYTIDDGECVVKTCQVGYKKSGARCVDDLESEYIGAVGSFTVVSNVAPIGYTTSAIDEAHLVPFQASDTAENIRSASGVLVASNPGDERLSNLCRRTCVRTPACSGVFLAGDDTCRMLSADFDFDTDVQQDVAGATLLKKNSV
jgi:hypothetical protein